MAKITTADCRKFLVSQVEDVIYPATSWAYDEDAAWDELHNKRLDQPDTPSLDENDPRVIQEIKSIRDQLEFEVFAILSKESNWKRYHKEKGEGDVVATRRFNCDTTDGRFDGQVAYEVVEHRDGSLSLGQYVGD